MENENPTVEDLKSEKRDIEDKIYDLISDFEYKYNLKVEEISIIPPASTRRIAKIRLGINISKSFTSCMKNE